MTKSNLRQLLFTLWTLISLAIANSKEADPSSHLHVHDNDGKPGKKLEVKFAKEDKSRLEDETSTTTLQLEIQSDGVFLQKLIGEVAKQDSHARSVKNLDEVEKSNGAGIALPFQPPQDTTSLHNETSSSDDTSSVKFELSDRIGRQVIITLAGPSNTPKK